MTIYCHPLLHKEAIELSTLVKAFTFWPNTVFYFFKCLKI
jgi:hypothetical protein